MLDRRARNGRTGSASAGEGATPAVQPAVPPTSWLRYARRFADQRALLAWAFLAALVRVATLLPVPLLVETVLRQARHGAPRSDLLVMGVAILALQLAGLLGHVWSRTRIHAAVLSVTQRMREDALSHVLAIPPARAEEFGPARLHDQILHETDRIDVAGRLLLADLLPSALATVGLLLVLAALDPRLLALLAALAPVFALSYLFPGPALVRAARERNLACARFSGDVLRGLRALDQTHSQGGRPWLLDRQRKALDLYQSASAWSFRLGERSRAWQQALVAAGSLAVLVAGVLWVASGRIEIEGLAGFFAGLALIRGPVAMLLTSALPISEGRASLDSFFALLDEPVTGSTGTRRLEGFDGRVSLREVDFAFGSRPVLCGLDLDLAPGRCVVVVGPVGAGKSTLLRLTLGLVSPTRGSIRVEGHELGDLDPAWFRSQVAYLPQAPVLLAGSVRENVLFGRPDPDSVQLTEALQLAGADEWLSLRGGTDAEVGEEGALLSGGQRQQIALARALFGRPRLLLLDEPTNHLPALAARSLFSRLRSLPWQPGLLIATHDPSVASGAGDVYRLVDGRLVP